MLLGDMGAEIIKIEDPRHGDDTRAWAPFVGGWSTYFLSVNRNKKSVAIDSKSAEGRALLEKPDSRVPTCSSRTSGRARSSGWDSGPTGRGR